MCTVRGAVRRALWAELRAEQRDLAEYVIAVGESHPERLCVLDLAKQKVQRKHDFRDL